MVKIKLNLLSHAINLFIFTCNEQTNKYNLTSFLQYSKGSFEGTTLTLSKQLSEDFDKEIGIIFKFL